MVMNTNIVPNHMTTLGLIIGLLASVVTIYATATSLWLLAVGGILYQMSSMLDGCDGEIARLKFKHSDTGEWYDTVSDDVINLFYQVAVGYALFQITGSAIWFHLSIATFIIGWIVAGALYRKLLAQGNGTHLAIDFGLNGENLSYLAKFCARVEFIARRDFYALLLMVLTFIGPVALQIVSAAAFLTVTITGVQWALVNVRRPTQATPRDRDTASARG
jgi:phosphatidylglycerophosphate synthase